MYSLVYCIVTGQNNREPSIERVIVCAVDLFKAIWDLFVGFSRNIWDKFSLLSGSVKHQVSSLQISREKKILLSFLFLIVVYLSSNIYNNYNLLSPDGKILFLSVAKLGFLIGVIYPFIRIIAYLPVQSSVPNSNTKCSIEASDHDKGKSYKINKKSLIVKLILCCMLLLM